MAGQVTEPMSTVGQIEKKTQERVVKLFEEQLGYDYLGDWTERDGNRNIEEDLLRTFLAEKQAMTRNSSRGRCTCSTRQLAIPTRASMIATMPFMTCCATA
jgi:hypothetical protein